jgi:hypothetical protein
LRVYETFTCSKPRRKEMGAEGKKRDVEKERYWRRVIGEAARSGISIRRFCQERKLKESQFYWWQSRLRAGEKRQQARAFGGGSASQVTRDSRQATFALVSEDGGELGSAGIELVLRGGRRLRVGKGVDEETLRTVVGVLEEGC